MVDAGSTQFVEKRTPMVEVDTTEMARTQACQHQLSLYACEQVEQEYLQNLSINLASSSEADMIAKSMAMATHLTRAIA